MSGCFIADNKFLHFSDSVGKSKIPVSNPRDNPDNNDSTKCLSGWFFNSFFNTVKFIGVLACNEISSGRSHFPLLNPEDGHTFEGCESLHSSHRCTTFVLECCRLHLA